MPSSEKVGEGQECGFFVDESQVFSLLTVLHFPNHMP